MANAATTTTTEKLRIQSLLLMCLFLCGGWELNSNIKTIFKHTAKINNNYKKISIKN